MKIFFVSLGCDKNLIDSEHMLGSLSKDGYTITDQEEEADVIIVNSCCFIDSAKEESIETILEMAEYKKEGRCKALIVAGCMAQRYKEEVLKEIPEVDAILGTTAYDQIGQIVKEAMGGQTPVRMEDLSELPGSDSKRILTTGGFYEYLKISEGCNKNCAYCVIPSVRGPYRSVPMEKVLGEARELADQGVKELILVAQETTRYGVDLYGTKMLHILLKDLCEIPGIRWIRILYCYPEEIYPEMVRVMKEEPKICHYLDLPIQHCSDTVLKRMGRYTNKKELTERIAYLRREIPDIALRTTLITGFPGETEQEHQEMLDFIKEIRFDRLGVFTYSQEEGTRAAEMPDQIPEEIKLDRRDALMEAQQQISTERGRSLEGKTMDVFVEGYAGEEDAYIGRTYADAPNVDGYFFINTDQTLHSGDFVKARVTGAMEYDLIGETVEED